MAPPPPPYLFPACSNRPRPKSAASRVAPQIPRPQCCKNPHATASAWPARTVRPPSPNSPDRESTTRSALAASPSPHPRAALAEFRDPAPPENPPRPPAVSPLRAPRAKLRESPSAATPHPLQCAALPTPRDTTASPFAGTLPAPPDPPHSSRSRPRLRP